MNTPTNVVHLRQPEELEDPLTDILRSGARRLLAQAVELEAETFLAGMQALKLPDGRDRLVRHGYGPERMIQTGIGPVAVSRVKIRDRGAASDDDRVEQPLDPALKRALLESGGAFEALAGAAKQWEATRRECST